MSPGSVDQALVRRHLAALDMAVQQLRRHVGVSAEALAGDVDRLWAVERGLQLCAQHSIDVATHLAASAGRDPQDYATAVDDLVPIGVLPAEFAARFRGVAGFRNVLVHGYLDIEVGRVCEVLATRLDDFAVFAAHVERHLDD